VSGIGHLALPVHPAVATGIRQALDTDAQESGAESTGTTRTTATTRTTRTTGTTDTEGIGKSAGGLTVA
jgi:hypothetical protein